MKISAKTDRKIRLSLDLLFGQNLTPKAKLHRSWVLLLLWALVCWNNYRNVSAGLQVETGFSQALFVLSMLMIGFTFVVFAAVHISNIVGYFWDRGIRHP